MAAGEGENPFRFSMFVTPSCQPNGGRVVVNVVTDLSEPIQYAIVGQNTGFSRNATTSASSYTFEEVPNDIYTASARALTTAGAEGSKEVVISCASGPPAEPVDDLVLTISGTNPTEPGLADGSATFNVATSNPPFKTRIGDDTVPYTPGKTLYTGLAAGEYLGFVMDDAGFVRFQTFTLTDPATPPPAPAMYYAVGGVLPNPINFTLNFDPLSFGSPKIRHHVEVELTVAGITLDTIRQRVNNGVSVVDVSAYLKRTLSLGNTLSLMHSEDEVKPFSIRYREIFNGQVGMWKVDKQLRYAVQAALQDYNSDFNAYVVRSSYDPEAEQTDEYYKWHTSFEVPIKWACHGTFLTTIIDKSLTGTALYFERSYYASNNLLVERKSTLIEEEDYGKLLRLQITDDVLPCANYVDAVITDVFREQPGSCPEGTPPPIGYKVFDFTFNESFE